MNNKSVIISAWAETHARNQVIAVIKQDLTTGELRQEFIQPEDQTAEMMHLFAVSEAAHSSMLSAIRKNKNDK